MADDYAAGMLDEDGETTWWIDRFLQEKKNDDDGRIDFTVLSVTVMTLGLIMIVEVVRHRIDHSAHGRAFFHAVLETLYNERKLRKERR